MGKFRGYKTYGEPSRTDLAKARLKKAGSGLKKAGSWIGNKYSEYKDEYKEYKMNAPKRQHARITQLRRDVKEQKLKTQLMKEKASQKKFSPSYTFGGFSGPTQKGPSIGVADAILGSSGKRSKSMTMPKIRI